VHFTDTHLELAFVWPTYLSAVNLGQVPKVRFPRDSLLSLLQQVCLWTILKQIPFSLPNQHHCGAGGHFAKILDISCFSAMTIGCQYVLYFDCSDSVDLHITN